MNSKKLVIAATVLGFFVAGGARAQATAEQKARAEAELKAQQAQHAAKAKEYDVQVSDKRRQEAEVRMREAERKMRDAERQLREAAREMAEVHGHQANVDARRHMVWFGKKARLGVVVNLEADPKSDPVGARLTAVTPGGPADQAGLKAGDVIVKLDGKTLAGANPEVGEDASAPGQRLVELAAGLDDGDTVAVVYKRGTETKTAEIKAEAMTPRAMRVYVDEPEFEFEVPDIDVDVDVPDVHVDRMRDMKVKVVTEGGGWLDLELASIDGDLGEYFGTSDGVLVVRVPKDDVLKLKTGDVIVSIGDRAVSKPSQALRILRSYEPGETATMQVIRKKQPVKIAVEMPKHRSATWVVRDGDGDVPPPPPPPPPAPPAPAAKPARPAPGADSTSTL
ncbi:MAG: PDZ domain-containing protein [Acidobacteria bacterium]|nr:PDZ domain-containing protein [Acidobacteriota bacterium]